METQRTRAEGEGHEFREVSLVELRTTLSELVSQVSYTDEEVLITRNGKRVAALISMRAFQLLQERVEALEDAADDTALAQAEDAEGYRPLAPKKPRRKSKTSRSS